MPVYRLGASLPRRRPGAARVAGVARGVFYRRARLIRAFKAARSQARWPDRFRSGFCRGLAGQQLFAVRAQGAAGIDMAVEGLAGDFQLAAQFADLRLRLAHRRHGEPQLGRGHLVRPPAVAAPGAGRRQARLGALDDQIPLKLRQGREDAEHQLARRRGGVDGGTLAGQHLQADAAHGQLVNQVDQVAQIPPQPVQLPHHQGVAGPQSLDAGHQALAVVALARGLIFIKARRLHPPPPTARRAANPASGSRPPSTRAYSRSACCGPAFP